MASLLNHAKQVWGKVVAAPAQEHSILHIEDDHVLDEPRPARDLIGDQTYFEVEVNEAWLTIGRRWLKSYQPMVYTVTEFDYKGVTEAAPFVVGPSLLTRRGEDIPTEGVIFRDTRVAGPYPFGGRVGLAVVLCAVVEDDHARDLLGVVESAAGALDFAATVTPYLKVAGVVLDGVDALFGAKKAEPVAGVRSEFDYRDGLRSPHYIAIVASSDLADTTLWVRNGRLEEGPDKENTKAFRRADYVLFSLTGDVTRADVDGLPFAPLRDRALAQANRATTDELWREAKSTLFAASEEALGSPDLIEVHADALIDEWEQRAVTLYGRAKRRADMARTTDGDDGRQRRVARLLDL